MYVVGGKVTDEDGPLEIQMGKDQVLFDAGSDGEELHVSFQSWQDPFSRPLSPENAEYVKSVGKWTALDVSDRSPFRGLIGSAAGAVQLNCNPFGKVIGLVASYPRGKLILNVGVDNLLVNVAAPNGPSTRSI